MPTRSAKSWLLRLQEKTVSQLGIAIHTLVLFSAVSGAVEHGNHYSLNLVYEHILERSSFNMTFGPFGGVKGMFGM